MHWDFPYPARRVPVLADNVVASSQPLATQAGLRMLQDGGSAADAIIACAAALTVVEPVMNGLGSDAFALLWKDGGLEGLNGSGRAPAAWTPDRFSGRESMPSEGWDTVTVPGAVSAWVALWRRAGRLPFERVLAPAIHYAENGFIVSPTVARQWRTQAPLLAQQPGFAEAFFRGGRTPDPGERFRFPEQAFTLRRIAQTEGEAFYRGDLSERMAQFAARTGGGLSAADLEAHRADWVIPIGQDYRGYTLHEIPPNGQGIAALMALGMLEGFDLASMAPESPDSVHLQVEAMKLAFADTYAHVADPAAMRVGVADMLCASYLKARAARIDPRRAGKAPAGVPPASGTVYLTAADQSGIMVSYIQSNYNGFGSGVVVPGTGISLQNRGAGFTLQPGHPNEAGPGKRPFHTIIPAFLSRAGEAIMSFGVMGADMQPQGHVQMVIRLADHDQNPQAAADAPRWKVAKDGSLLVESHMPAATVEELARRGHRVRRAAADSLEFGSAQLIRRLPSSGYAAASETRRDGQAAGF
ncbi:MAG: gamma-glutamyltransferase family protein [Betaproteobacteria bacterium]|jgi:gamma-glutamyltranspeptidase/glutathione hydrolase|nr:gamma-glutamyltransferase family protein [Betaproteobacteria bacterium]